MWIGGLEAEDGAAPGRGSVLCVSVKGITLSTVATRSAKIHRQKQYLILCNTNHFHLDKNQLNTNIRYLSDTLIAQ